MASRFTPLVASPRDTRDIPYRPLAAESINFGRLDLRTYVRNIENQGQVGSCSANAVTSAVELLLVKMDDLDVQLSRLFNYYTARSLEKNTGKDAGVHSLRSNLKAATKHGIPPEVLWPYHEERVLCRPSKRAFDAADAVRVQRYERITPTGPAGLQHDIRSALTEGYPVVFCATIGERWESLGGPLPRQKYVPVGRGNKQAGGHAMMIVGAAEGAQGYFIVENSWGTDWGDGGYGALPIACLVDVWEAWVVKAA